MPDNMSDNDITKYRIETLEAKIVNAFGDSITVEIFAEPNQKKIIYLRDIG